MTFMYFHVLYMILAHSAVRLTQTLRFTSSHLAGRCHTSPPPASYGRVSPQLPYHVCGVLGAGAVAQRGDGVRYCPDAECTTTIIKICIIRSSYQYLKC